MGIRNFGMIVDSNHCGSERRMTHRTFARIQWTQFKFQNAKSTQRQAKAEQVPQVQEADQRPLRRQGRYVHEVQARSQVRGADFKMLWEMQVVALHILQVR